MAFFTYRHIAPIAPHQTSPLPGQVSPSGSVLYSGEERAPPLLVLQAPTLQPGTREHLVWREGLEVTASFTARPRPLEEQVQVREWNWRLAETREVEKRSTNKGVYSKHTRTN